MTKKEFVTKYRSVYIIENADEDDNRVEIIGIQKLNESYDVPVDKVIIDFHEDSCNIYQEFTYEDYDSLFAVCETNRYQLMFMQELGKVYGIPPSTDFYDGMGCPFVDELVGYFNVEYKPELIEHILSAFNSVLTSREATDFDIDYLTTHFESEYSIYMTYEEDIKFAYRLLMEPGYSRAFDKYPLQFKANDEVYIDAQGTFIVGFGDDTLKKVSNFIDIKMFRAKEVFIGLEYCFLRTGKLSISLNSNYIGRIKKFLDLVKIEDSNSLEYGLNQKGALIKTPYSDFWAIVLPLSGAQEIYAVQERENFRALYSELKPFIPTSLLNEEYNFSKLDDYGFEKMCRDLLIDMGFFNVSQRGNTNASDGGVDIEADMIVKTLFGDDKQHWIFQCKHTKAQISRKDISEIPDLLTEFNAKGYGLFYTGMLSPQTLDRIKGKENTIKYWAKGELETLLRKYPRTSTRYFGI